MTQFYPDLRLGLIIDGAAIFAASKECGFRVDFKKILDYFKNRGRLMHALYYTMLWQDFDDNEKTPLMPLVDFLQYNGYIVTTRRSREFEHGDGENMRTKRIGDFESELIVDTIKMAKNCGQIVLFSGNGNYTPMVKFVQEEFGCKVFVCSTKGDGAQCSDALRRQADVFIDMKDMAAVFAIEEKDRLKVLA